MSFSLPGREDYDPKPSSGKHSKFPLWLTVAIVALVLAGATMVIVWTAGIGDDARIGAAPSHGVGTPTTPSPSPSPSTRAALLQPRPVAIPAVAGQTVAWALADVATGRTLAQSANTVATSTTESMIKTWIAADYLRQHPKVTGHRLDQIRAMIRVSDNDAAEDVYGAGGNDLVINRMIKTCGLTGTTIVSGWWSRTTMTAADAARLGTCVANGRAAGPEWTPWLLDEMRAVTGRVTEQTATKTGGRWGIVDALPPGTDAAIKNGWTIRGDEWHVNCLAIVDRTQSLAVMTRYPARLGLAHGAHLCATVAAQLQAA